MSGSRGNSLFGSGGDDYGEGNGRDDHVEGNGGGGIYQDGKGEQQFDNGVLELA